MVPPALGRLSTTNDWPNVCENADSRFAGRFNRAAGTTAERAHGDGVEVGLDSPEAFEEMLWMAFWPEHYRENAILPWSTSIPISVTAMLLAVDHVRVLVVWSTPGA